MRPTKAFPVLFFLIISAIFLRGVIFSSGIIIGADWGFPLTHQQIQVYFNNCLYTWTHVMNLLGARKSFFVDIPFGLLIKAFSELGVEGDVFSKLFLFSIYFFSGISVYSLCRYLGCRKHSSILGGFILITMPFFFNYSIMGWTFVLFSVGVILPWAVISFIKSVEENNLRFSLATGLLYSLAAIQTQSIIWYPLVFLALAVYLIKDKKTFFKYLRSFLFILLTFLLIHAAWWPSLFFYRDTNILGSKLVNETMSLGTWARLSFSNIIRGWGSIFNYQYETAYPYSLLFASFLTPLTVVFSLLFLKKKRKTVIPFFLIFLVPLFLFCLGPKVIAKIPFSNFIRDIARFISISSFAATILMTIFFDFLLRSKSKILNYSAVFFIFLVLFNSFPFFSGKLYGEQKSTHDVRLRTYDFPDDYRIVEDYLANLSTNSRAFYLPGDEVVYSSSNLYFSGNYHGMRDLFKIYSPLAGGINLYNSGAGKPQNIDLLVNQLMEKRQWDDLVRLLRFLGVSQIVVRKDLDYSYIVNYQFIKNFLEKEKEIKKRDDLDFENIVVFENESCFPHFYVPQKLVLSSAGIGVLPELLDLYENNPALGIYFQTFVSEATPKKAPLALNKFNEFLVEVEPENLKEAIIGLGAPDEEVIYPYVKHRPGGAFYSLVFLKEKGDELWARKNLEKLVDKKLFYANKRINETLQFGADRSEAYQNKLGEIINLIKGVKNTETRILLAVKTKNYLLDNEKRISKLSEKAKGNFPFAFGVIKKQLEEIYQWSEADFVNLEYSFEVPEQGNYELYLGGLAPELLLSLTIDSQNYEQEENWEDESKLSKVRDLELRAGEHQGAIQLFSLENLANQEWKVFKELSLEEGDIQFSPQGFYPNADNIIYQNIRNWEPNSLYYLSFDYELSGGVLGLGVLEQNTTYFQGKDRLVTEKILEKKLEISVADELSESNLSEKSWDNYQTIIRSSPNAIKADIYLYAIAKPNQFAKLNFKNFKINKVRNPKVILKADLGNEVFDGNSPVITFTKINPAKYLVEVKNAQGPYELIFNETFNLGWRAYISEANSNSSLDEDDLLSANYFGEKVKEKIQQNLFLGGNIFETWGKKSIPSDRHFLVNGYANAWHITPEDSNDRGDYEIIIEFLPQKLFYLGFFVSLNTLVFSLGWFLIDFRKKRPRFMGKSKRDF
ncbi:MAG: hypothetical protein ABIB61_02380 [Candidatus Shapirobacteria bacterium]